MQSSTAKKRHASKLSNAQRCLWQQLPLIATLALAPCTELHYRFTLDSNKGLQAASAEVQSLKRSVEAKVETLASQSKEIESLQNEVEEARSEALRASEAAAGLQLDLANARDQLASQVAIAASAAEDAEAEKRAMTENRLLLERHFAEEVCAPSFMTEV